MPAQDQLRFRAAERGDAAAIAALHVASWRRHYRGAFSDAFLDGEVAGFLLDTWTTRLAAPDPLARTILAELRRSGDGDGDRAKPAAGRSSKAATCGRRPTTRPA
jgi:hypothetical protein